MIVKASASTGPRLIATPANAAVDQAVRITIDGLKAGERVTVRAEQQRFGFPLRSEATFIADSHGRVFVDKDAPVSGDYSGVDPMGIVWSMKLAGKPQDTSFKPEGEIAQFDITLKLLSGSRLLATSALHRYVVASSLIHREIDRNGLVAAYFAPRDGAKHPAVVILNGSDGGLQRDTAALLAGHGYCTLAVAYFGIGSLPKYLGDIPVETVVRAITALQAMPEVDGKRIGVMGFSKGAELALLSASHLGSLKAVVAYAPSSVVFAGITPQKVKESSWTLRGKPFPFADGPVPATLSQRIDKAFALNQPVEYAPWYLAKLSGANAGASIPVELIRGPVMLIAGGDDRLWPSSVMARQIAARLRKLNHRYADESLIYPKAGHAIDAPYVPTPHTVSAGSLLLGGTAPANASADIDSWKRVLAFLRARL
ncbi:MAG TPA: acyl-CoA thioester hydrolase/BAAT C-terminal domain-containing protein [Candidatus Eremiobacteraceae bacterium]|nr:acyl-CoA thioester hydrolase/BAAT C-terminal domain-containing protein [Candidatus Eremiobacteraceae bacterium]